MPAKVLPRPEDFLWLRNELREWGFRSINSVEFRADFKRLLLQAPRPRPGREAGFVFTANGLTAKVWTTWLEREGMAREIDEAWVLITENDRALYFSRPIHRTKGFVRNLLAQAWLVRQRVLHRPLCPQCQQFMEIVKGSGLKSRYWICRRSHKHPGRVVEYLGWDEPLPSEDQQAARALRRKRQSYEGKRKKEGKPLHSALLKRRPWQRAS